MIDLLRWLLVVHSPSRHGMTKKEIEKLGEEMSKGFLDGWNATIERCKAIPPMGEQK